MTTEADCEETSSKMAEAIRSCNTTFSNSTMQHVNINVVAGDMNVSESLSKKQELPAEKSKSFSLVQNYADLVQKRCYSEANAIAPEILETLQGLGATAEDLKKTGEGMRVEGSYFESILYFDLSADVFAKQNDENGAESMWGCVMGLKETAISMLGAPRLPQRLENKKIIREHVIPLMQKMATQVRNMKSVRDEVKCVQEVWCLNSIEWTYHLLEDDSSHEATMKQALEMMRTQFGDGAERYQVYGILLNNLGNHYGKTNRLDQSVDLYKRAISCFRLAGDIEDENRKSWIKATENNLQRAQEELR